MNNKQIIEAINNVRHKMKLDMNNDEIMEVIHDLNILEEKLKEQEQTGNKFRERKRIMQSEYHCRFDNIENRLQRLMNTQDKDGNIITTYETILEIFRMVRNFRNSIS